MVCLHLKEYEGRYPCQAWLWCHQSAKMAKQSDEKLAALHKQVSASDQSLPSNQFMMKRVSKEMNRRKKAT